MRPANVALQTLRDKLDVSRETEQRLQDYAALLVKWTQRINLISKRSAEDLWTRHILDSAQLWKFCPPRAGHWADLGSGGGLPGLVIAVLAAQFRPGLRVTLVESDTRKSVFLQTAARELALSCQVLNDRVERVAPLCADVISARALGSLDLLLSLAEKHRAPNSVCLFPKGETFRQELTQARRIWQIEADVCASQTDQAGVILRIGEFARV